MPLSRGRKRDMRYIQHLLVRRICRMGCLSADPGKELPTCKGKQMPAHTRRVCISISISQNLVVVVSMRSILKITGPHAVRPFA